MKGIASHPFLALCTLESQFHKKLVHSTLFQLFVFQIEVDELVIPRTVLVVFLCIFALIAFVFLALHWMEPIYSPALTSRKTYTF